VKDLPLAANEVLIEYALGEEPALSRGGPGWSAVSASLALGRKALEARVREFMEPLLNSQAGGFSLKKGQELYDLLLANPCYGGPGRTSDNCPGRHPGSAALEALVIAAGSDPETSIFVGDQRILWYYPSVAVLATAGRAENPTTRLLLAWESRFILLRKKRPRRQAEKSGKIR